MAPLPQRSLSICAVQPRVPSASTSLFSQSWLCQLLLPALALGLSSAPAGIMEAENFRNHPNLKPKRSQTRSSWQVCVCEAQSCPQQLTQLVHLAQGAVSRCLPLNSSVWTLFPRQSYSNQSRAEAFQVEQAGAIPSQTLGQTSGTDKMKHSGNKPTLLIIKRFAISHKFCSFSSFHCLHSCNFSESSQRGPLLPSNST